jgi:hypothetical protein
MSLIVFLEMEGVQEGIGAELEREIQFRALVTS